MCYANNEMIGPSRPSSTSAYNGPEPDAPPLVSDSISVYTECFFDWSNESKIPL